MGLFSSSLLAQQNIAICPIKPLDRGQTTASNIKEFFGNFKNAGRTKISEFLCCLPQNVRDGVMVAVWDALFWRFLKKNKAFFKKQPRLSYITRYIDSKAKPAVVKLANSFIKKGKV
jgi:hypothetical protein